MAEPRATRLNREYSHAYTGPKPNDALIRGVKSWLPDIPGFIGDIGDAAVYAAKRAAGQRNPAPAGLGAAARRRVQERLYGQKPSTEVEVSAPYEPSGEELVTQMLNPAFLVNPTTIARNPALAGGVAALLGAPVEALGGLGALGVVKPKGGNWLAGSVEEALKGLYRRAPPRGASDEQVSVIDKWIEGPLTKYIKTRMATPDDEVRKLAEQGVLHFDTTQGWVPDADTRRSESAAMGLPAKRMGVSQTAQDWEDLADVTIGNVPLGEIWAQPKLATHKAIIAKNPWIQPGVKGVAHTFADSDTLGLEHLIDELRNATNPASGLPRHLQLSPEAIQNLSMEKAVRRVDEINKWRGEQMAKANAEATAGRPLIREYAENNPKGLRWVQLNRKGDFAAESNAMGHSVRGYEPPEGGGSPHYGLGGWDAIQSGKAKIYSLQDAKGEPHVTVEVESIGEDFIDLAAKKLGYGDTRLEELADQFGPEEAERIGDEVYSLAQQLEEAYAKNPNPSFQIVQIKGKQNRKPNDEYLPFVQDFVRNSPLGSPWSEVGDLGNTGLRRIDYSTFGSLGPSGEAAVNQLRESGKHFLTDKELQEAYDAVYNTGRLPEGYRQGGSVTFDDRLAALRSLLN